MGTVEVKLGTVDETGAVLLEDTAAAVEEDEEGSAVRKRLVFSFSCCAAALRPLLVKGKLSTPTGCECSLLSRNERSA
jgi:hypothetical protein